MVEAAIPDGCRPAFPVVWHGSEPVLLLPVLHGPGGHLSSLVTPYTCVYQPAVWSNERLEPAAAVLARHLGPALRIDAVDPAWAGWPAIMRGFRLANYRAMGFAGFANWHEPLLGRGWEAYLADRPGALRETIRRRLRAAERNPEFSIGIAGPEETEAYLADYEAVYKQSWKAPEPFPGFAGAFVKAAEAAGVLRLAVLRRGTRPLAAQYWTVEKGVATVLKLTHVETERATSPGTVLTAWMVRHLIETEGVSALDFGRGDDPYKRHWATERRQREGMIVGNPLRPRGVAVLLRQAGSRIIGRLRG